MRGGDGQSRQRLASEVPTILTFSGAKKGGFPPSQNVFSQETK